MQKKFIHLQARILVATLFLNVGISVSSCFSQNIASSNLIWQANKAIDLQTQDTILYSAQIKTNGSESMEWVQKNRTQTSTYQVTGTEGSWMNVSLEGSFTFLLSKNNHNARMTIERNSSGVFIVLRLGDPGQYTFQQRFCIQSVQPAN